MLTTLLADPASDQRYQRPEARTRFGTLINALGTPRFSEELLQFLKELSGVEYVHFFQMLGGRPHVLSAVSLDASGKAERQAEYYLSRKLFTQDPWVTDWMEDPSRNPVLFHVGRPNDGWARMRDYYDAMQISDRVMVCGQAQEGIVGISLARSQQHGPFDDMRERLELIRDVALPLFIKHRDFCWQRTKFSRELLNVAEIERRMQLVPDKLPRREIQVAARTIRGMTASGIALDLGIGRETVICYRKRLYEKLALGSYHDLLSWYLCSISEDMPAACN